MQTIRICAVAVSLLALQAVSLAQGNLPPVVSTGGNSGLDYRVDCNNTFVQGTAVTSVQLDGSGSFDPNGTPVTFFWHNECTGAWFDDPTSPTPVYHVDMTGSCSRDCWIALRVTSGGQTSIRGFQVFVEDATAPSLTVPNHVVGIFGDPTAVGATGFATAFDNCDPAPALVHDDVSVLPVGPGQPEERIERTWTTTDCSGRATQGVQVIELVAPTGDVGERANLDFDPQSCPNLYATGSAGTVDVLLLGVPSFRADRVDKLSLRMFLGSNPGVTLAPQAVFTRDLGSLGAVNYGDCNLTSLDGIKDQRLRFQKSAVDTLFALGGVQSGQTVEVMVTGRLINGKLFGTRDVVTVQ